MCVKFPDSVKSGTVVDFNRASFQMSPRYKSRFFTCCCRYSILLERTVVHLTSLNSFVKQMNLRACACRPCRLVVLRATHLYLQLDLLLFNMMTYHLFDQIFEDPMTAAMMTFLLDRYAPCSHSHQFDTKRGSK